MDDNVDTETHFLERSKREFDTAVDATDARVAASLRMARARALDAAEARTWRLPAAVWLPAAAAAGLAAIVLVPRLDSVGPSEPRDLGAMAAADLELLLGEEAFEMFAELEFYEWLEMQEGAGTDDGTEDGVG